MTQFENWIESLPIDNISAIKNRATNDVYFITRIEGEKLYYEVDSIENFVIWKTKAREVWQGLKKKSQ